MFLRKLFGFSSTTPTQSLTEEKKMENLSAIPTDYVHIPTANFTAKINEYESKFDDGAVIVQKSTYKSKEFIQIANLIEATLTKKSAKATEIFAQSREEAARSTPSIQAAALPKSTQDAKTKSYFELLISQAQLKPTQNRHRLKPFKVKNHVAEISSPAELQNEILLGITPPAAALNFLAATRSGIDSKLKQQHARNQTQLEQIKPLLQESTNKRPRR